MKTRLAFSLIILVLQWAVAGAVYAQESIPETLKRHDQELKAEILNLKRSLQELQGLKERTAQLEIALEEARQAVQNLNKRLKSPSSTTGESLARKPESVVIRIFRTGSPSIQLMRVSEGHCKLTKQYPSDRIYLETIDGFWVLNGEKIVGGVGTARCELYAVQ